MKYKVRLFNRSGTITQVREFWAATDEGALARGRELLVETGADPFEVWSGPRQIAERRGRGSRA